METPIATGSSPGTPEPSRDRFVSRHRILSGLVFLGAVTTFVTALWLDYALEHAITESLVPLGFGIVALWAWPDRWQLVGLVAAGLFSAQAILLHLLHGSPWGHALFFIVTALLATYRTGLTALYAVVYVIGQHAVLGVYEPHSVYGDDSALSIRLILMGLQLTWIGLVHAATKRVPE